MAEPHRFLSVDKDGDEVVLNVVRPSGTIIRVPLDVSDLARLATDSTRMLAVTAFDHESRVLREQRGKRIRQPRHDVGKPSAGW